MLSYLSEDKVTSDVDMRIGEIERKVLSTLTRSGGSLKGGTESSLRGHWEGCGCCDVDLNEAVFLVGVRLI